MIKIIITCDSYKHFEESILEYEKRLKKDIEIMKIKSYKSTNIKEIIFKETCLIKEKLISQKWYKILLYIWWEQFDTLSFKEFIFDKIDKFSNIIFIIWWAYWVDYDLLKDNIDKNISLSNMTFPHSMAYMILLEQIYRSFMIKKWSDYHH